MKIGRGFMKCAEFIERQAKLALEFARPLIRKAPNPALEARRLIARAIRLIERNTDPKHGAAAVGAALAHACRPYFGTDLSIIQGALQ